MSVKLTQLAEQAGLSTAELKVKLKEFGFEVKPNARVIDEETAQLVLSELKKSPKSAEPQDSTSPGPADSTILEEDFSKPDEKNTIDVYQAVVEKQLDKEIIKSQRKMTAGKDTRPKMTGYQTFRGPVVAAPPPPGSEIEIPDAISVKEFSEKTGINPVKVIGELMKNGILANINQIIDFETASIIADDLKIKIKRRRAAAAVEDIMAGNIEILMQEKDEHDLVTRPPIVTVMGHVDHGKTKLLDAIRETDVVSSEAGGITQHIGAYQVEKNGRKITFIDTPGHEAFTLMRARGAKITDIVILVVAADEGVKPQTIEALNHAKEAQVPIIVAINKIDKEDINIDRVKAQLAEQGLQPEDWGGKTIMTPVSAMTGQGIPILLEMILLVADMENLKANPNRPAVATVLEAHLDKSLGPVASIIVNTGTLRIQDSVVVGDICGRVKLMRNYVGVPSLAAPPATPVQIAGLEGVPHAGDALQVVTGMDEARKKADQIRLMREGLSQTTMAGNLEQIMSAIQAGKLKTLKVVLKADALGSLEALKMSIAQVRKDEVSVKIIHSGVGAITESDVMMAVASGGIVVGFNVLPNAHVSHVASQAGIQIFTYSIIYKLLDDLKKILSGLLEPEVTQVTLGHAEVKQIFLTEKRYLIIGCRITDGKIENKCKLRIMRNGEKVGEGFIETLKRINDVVKEIGEGNDCGIKFEGDVNLEVGDILEAWKEERRTRIIT